MGNGTPLTGFYTWPELNLHFPTIDSRGAQSNWCGDERKGSWWETQHEKDTKRHGQTSFGGRNPLSHPFDLLVVKTSFWDADHVWEKIVFPPKLLMPQIHSPQRKKLWAGLCWTVYAWEEIEKQTHYRKLLIPILSFYEIDGTVVGRHIKTKRISNHS